MTAAQVCLHSTLRLISSIQKLSPEKEGTGHSSQETLIKNQLAFYYLLPLNASTAIVAKRIRHMENSAAINRNSAVLLI